MPGPFDNGVMRFAWVCPLLTNWMGDAGFLKGLTGQYRAHVYLSDVVRLGGRVDSKEVDADGDRFFKSLCDAEERLTAVLAAA